MRHIRCTTAHRTKTVEQLLKRRVKSGARMKDSNSSESDVAMNIRSLFSLFLLVILVILFAAVFSTRIFGETMPEPGGKLIAPKARLQIVDESQNAKGRL